MEIKKEIEGKNANLQVFCMQQITWNLLLLNSKIELIALVEGFM